MKTPSIDVIDFLRALLHREAVPHLIRDPNGNQLTVVLSEEAIALAFKLLAPGEVVSDLAIMHDGDIRERSGPEGVAGIGKHRAFGGEPRMTEAVGADQIAHAMFFCNLE